MIDNNSPKFIARIGGVLYLGIIAITIFGEIFVRAPLIVLNNPLETTQNILSSMHLWRLSIAFDLVLVIFGISLAFVFYNLLKKVNNNYILLFLFFNLIAFCLEAASKVSLFSILVLLEDPYYLTVMPENLIYAQVSFYLDVYAYVFSAGMVFFGCGCIVLGSLMYKSGFFPKIFGVLMPITGICWITNAFIQFIFPSLFLEISPAILLPAFVTEISLCAWLVIFGVRSKDWASLSDGTPEEPLAQVS